MTDLIHDLIVNTAQHLPHAEAILYQERSMNYAALANETEARAHGLRSLGLVRDLFGKTIRSCHSDLRHFSGRWRVCADQSDIEARASELYFKRLRCADIGDIARPTQDIASSLGGLS